MENQSTFMLMFPAYALFDDTCKGPLCYTGKGGDVGLLLFSDFQQLERFRREEGRVGPAIQFESAPQVAIYLDALPGNITHVMLDPSTKTQIGTRAAHVATFQQFVDIVMKMIQSGQG